MGFVELPVKMGSSALTRFAGENVKTDKVEDSDHECAIGELYVRALYSLKTVCRCSKAVSCFLPL